jgi:hypothetical protein
MYISRGPERAEPFSDARQLICGAQGQVHHIDGRRRSSRNSRKPWSTTTLARQRSHYLWYVDRRISEVRWTACLETGTNVSMVGAMAVTQYLPPNPPVGSGPHRLASSWDGSCQIRVGELSGLHFRYPILLFVQPADFIAPPSLSKPNMGGGIFVVEDYVRVSC